MGLLEEWIRFPSSSLTMKRENVKLFDLERREVWAWRLLYVENAL